MNDFSELEAELQRLRPAAPTAELVARVERSLGEDRPAAPATAGILPRPQKARFNWLFLGLGFAATAAVLLLVRTNVDHPPQKQPTFAATQPAASTATSASARSLVPDGLTRVVYNRRDEGLVFQSNTEAPLRRVRSRSRETLQWKNPDSGASLRVSYPTEEVELIPVSGQ